MQVTFTPAEAAADLQGVIEQSRSAPVVIRDGDIELAMVVSPDRYREDRQLRAEQFERSRDAMVAELSENLQKASIDYLTFVDEFLR